MKSSSIDFNYEKELIYQEAQREAERLKELKEALLEATTYKKGEITKEVFKLPMPTSKNFLSNKNVNVKTYGAIMLKSNWGGTFRNPNERYLYKDKFDEAIKEITEELNISQSTIKRHINKLKRCELQVVNEKFKVYTIELGKTASDELVYKLNYGTFNEKNGNLENFVTITNVALRKLVNAYSENSLRIYLFLLYKCYKGEAYIKQEEICEAIGLSYKTRKVVTDCVEALIKGGFISVRNDYSVTTRKNKSGDTLEHIIPNYFYSLSEDYLLDFKK